MQRRLDFRHVWIGSGAGCSGYLVSLHDKRVLYFRRAAETHIEFFLRRKSAG